MFRFLVGGGRGEEGVAGGGVILGELLSLLAGAWVVCKKEKEAFEILGIFPQEKKELLRAF